MLKYLFIFLIIAVVGYTQVTAPVSSFGVFQRPTGALLTDPTWDQQTGQGQDDFVGDGAGGYYGFYYKYQKISGIDNLIFRFRFNAYDANSGFTGNVRLGVDGDGDGNIDLYFGVSTGQGQLPTIVFQNPDAGKLNISPNTSGLSIQYGAIATSVNNYNYRLAEDSSQYPTKNGASVNPDAFLTFAIPFSNFKSVLDFQGISITPSSYLRWVAFTSTQANAVNQDVYGMGDLKTYGSTRYDDPYAGGFTDFYSVDGKRPVVPEPRYYGFILIFTSSIFFIYLRDKKLKNSIK
jgi:hypothetical protein